jgi:hypothetical protein
MRCDSTWFLDHTITSLFSITLSRATTPSILLPSAVSPAAGALPPSHFDRRRFSSVDTFRKPQAFGPPRGLLRTRPAFLSFAGRRLLLARASSFEPQGERDGRVATTIPSGLTKHLDTTLFYARHASALRDRGARRICIIYTLMSCGVLQAQCRFHRPLGRTRISVSHTATQVAVSAPGALRCRYRGYSTPLDRF